MANEENISPNDPDLLLAQKIGKALPHLDSLYQLDDTFLNNLLAFKKAQSEKKVPVNSTGIWDSIQSEIDQSASPGAHIFILSPAVRRYAIAAALLIAVFLGTIIYQNFSGPQLIGESFAAIQHIELNDGSTVTLRPYSKLYEYSASETLQEYTLQGEAYFSIASDPERTFAVQTSRSKVEVLGTKFVLSDWGNSSRVFLQEGRIRYSSLRTLESVVLEPGQSSVIDDITSIPQTTEADASVYTDWLNNELVFQNHPASMIFSELEQHFNISITYSASAGNETLSGSISLNELSSVLNDLELVLNGTFTKTGEQSYAFKLD